MNNTHGPPSFQLADTHCHLYTPPLSQDAPAVLSRATARGVNQFIVPAYDIDSWQTMDALSRLPGVFTTLGLHPWAADQVAKLFHSMDSENPPEPNNPQDRNIPPGEQPSSTTNPLPLLAAQCAGLRLEMETALSKPPPGFKPSPSFKIIPPPIAIGEIGLDYKIDIAGGQPGPELQRLVLRTQLELAVDNNLPVILHCRGAFEELLGEIKRFAGRLRGVLHAYSRGSDPAVHFINAGLHIGLGGAITRDRAKRVRLAATNLPLDKIVLETDAPYIGLDGVLPVDTEPGHVRDVAEALATLRCDTIETIAEVTTNNARELFQLPD
ncbi:MAG: TatD family hydrolase [Gemmatimonadales bacterium]|nr:TatD family hydrolase [Gemmatimonadales bacterium]